MKRALHERFWKMVDKNGPVPERCPELGPCWLWTGSKNALGYGFIRDEDGVLVRATHASLYLQVGVWPELCALHICDNPPCVRFSHLFEGTRAQNNQDAENKRRIPHHKGELNNAAKLTQAQADAIRTEYAENRGIITQAEIGKKYGVTYATVSNIVRGKFYKETTA